MNFNALVHYIIEWLQIIFNYMSDHFKSRRRLQLENMALRSQLSLLYHEVETGKRPKPRATPAFRQLWIFICKHCDNWRGLMAIFSPETVVSWAQNGQSYRWLRISKKGRPIISKKTISLIKRIHKENPLLSPEKIHEQLLSLNITDAPAPNTIAKYLPTPKKPPSEKRIQSWKTFLRNRSYQTWGMDYFTAPTLTFRILYVLIIINHGSRKLEHFAITSNPNVDWVKQQIRNATPYDHKPKYLVHDNDAVFVSKPFRKFLEACGIKPKKTSIKSPWQNPYAERVIGTIRRELLDHIIPINEKHLNHLLNEYVHCYYNPCRTHQGIDGRTPIPSPKYPPTTISETKLKATPVLGGLYHTYQKVA